MIYKLKMAEDIQIKEKQLERLLFQHFLLTYYQEYFVNGAVSNLSTTFHQDWVEYKSFFYGSTSSAKECALNWDSKIVLNFTKWCRDQKRDYQTGHSQLAFYSLLRNATDSATSQPHVNLHGPSALTYLLSCKLHLDMEKLQSAHKIVRTSDWLKAFNEQKNVLVLNKLLDLQDRKLLSFTQPSKQPVEVFACPVITEGQNEVTQSAKFHWDHVLDEAVWMEVDVREERRWKIAMSQVLAKDCAKVVQHTLQKGSKNLKNALVPVKKNNASMSLIKSENEIGFNLVTWEKALPLYKPFLAQASPTAKSFINFLSNSADCYFFMLDHLLSKAPLSSFLQKLQPLFVHKLGNPVADTALFRKRPSHPTVLRPPPAPINSHSNVLWSPDEDEFLLAAVKEYQYNWDLICRLLSPYDAVVTPQEKRKSPWDVFERWVSIDPISSSVTFVGANARSAYQLIESSQRSKQVRKPANLFNLYSYKSKRNRYYSMFEAFKKAARKRELISKQQNNKKPTGSQEPRNPSFALSNSSNMHVPTPLDLSKMKFERDHAMAIAAANQQRQAAFYLQNQASSSSKTGQIGNLGVLPRQGHPLSSNPALNTPHNKPLPAVGNSDSIPNSQPSNGIPTNTQNISRMKNEVKAPVEAGERQLASSQPASKRPRIDANDPQQLQNQQKIIGPFLQGQSQSNPALLANLAWQQQQYQMQQAIRNAAPHLSIQQQQQILQQQIQNQQNLLLAQQKQAAAQAAAQQQPNRINVNASPHAVKGRPYFPQQQNSPPNLYQQQSSFVTSTPHQSPPNPKAVTPAQQRIIAAQQAYAQQQQQQQQQQQLANNSINQPNSLNQAQASPVAMGSRVASGPKNSSFTNNNTNIPYTSPVNIDKKTAITQMYPNVNTVPPQQSE